MSARVGVTRRSRHDKERATGIPTSVRRDKRLGFSMIGIDRRNPLPGADRRLNGATNYTLSRRVRRRIRGPCFIPNVPTTFWTGKASYVPGCTFITQTYFFLSHFFSITCRPFWPPEADRGATVELAGPSRSRARQYGGLTPEPSRRK